MQNNTNNPETILTRPALLLLLSTLPLGLMILAFIFDRPANIISGIYRIILAPDVLLTDYLEVGGLGATLLNASLITLINIFIIYKLNMRITGSLVAGIYTILGFSFFGKNLFNIWPIYLGGLLYTKYNKIPYSNIMVVIMFATCLSPAVSQLAFSSGLAPYQGLFLATLVGLIIGFVITPLSSNMSKVHEGHNLYNVGLTSGVLGTLIYSVMKSFDLTIEKQLILSTQYDVFFRTAFIIFFAFLIGLGFIINKKSFKGYGKLLTCSGKLISDYTQLAGFGLTFINMGIMGLISIIFVYLAGGVLNGPIIGGILTVAGFSAFGKHPRNALPIMAGVFICASLGVWDIKSTAVIIGGLFGTTLAPLAGSYGPLAGVLAGFLHLAVVMNVGVVHGGINLYNNGFAGGLVAAILVPIFEAFRKK